MAVALSPVFAAALHAGRREFNAQFEQARRAHPALADSAFSAFLIHTADPLVCAVDSICPEQVVETVHAVYEMALTLVGLQIAGTNARSDWIDQTWRRVLCAAAPVVAREPQRIIAAMSNAAQNLATTADARTGHWIDTMEKLAPLAADADTLLRIGQVLAWCCGLAHYRNGAIAAADALPAPLALACIGAPAHHDWLAESEKLRANPWHLPGRPTQVNDMVARVGRFRGYGGLFPLPPRVTNDDGQILVRSGDVQWLLCADAYGATFHRILTPPAPAHMPKTSKLPVDIVLPPWLGTPTSFAETQHTLAVTGLLTHSVLLFARSRA